MINIRNWFSGSSSLPPPSPLDKWVGAALRNKKDRTLLEAYFAAGGTKDRVVRIAKRKSIDFESRGAKSLQSI